MPFDQYQPNASEVIAGRTQIATAADIVAGSHFGSTGAVLVIPADLAGAGGGNAPISGPYVTIGNPAGLTAERALTGTASQILITDNGPNSSVVLSMIPTGVLPAIYTNATVSVDATGRVTAAASGSVTDSFARTFAFMGS